MRERKRRHIDPQEREHCALREFGFATNLEHAHTESTSGKCYEYIMLCAWVKSSVDGCVASGRNEAFLTPAFTFAYQPDA